MRLILDGSDPYSERVKIVKRLMRRESQEEYPDVFKWAVQVLFFKGKAWMEICRIDNYIHRGESGSHIHEYGRRDVRREPMTFEEAEARIKMIGSRIILERFNLYENFRRQ
jgi:hypothetical protein